MDTMEEIMVLGMVLVMTCMTMITTLLEAMEWEMVMVIMVGITTDGISMDLNTKTNITKTNTAGSHMALEVIQNMGKAVYGLPLTALTVIHPVTAHLLGRLMTVMTKITM